LKTLWRKNAKTFFSSTQRQKNGNYGNFESYAQKKGNFDGNFGQKKLPKLPFSHFWESKSENTFPKLWE